MTTGAAYEAMARLLRQLDRDFSNLPRLRRAPVRVGPPKSFTPYVDLEARFEFSYPAEWKIRDDGGVQVSSAKLGSFARVDVVPRDADFWAHLGRAVRQEGGELTLAGMDPGPPARARGEARMREFRFSWDGTAYSLGNASIVLTLGNVLEPARSAAVERYEDKVLEAIRRSFKLGPGLIPEGGLGIPRRL